MRARLFVVLFAVTLGAHAKTTLLEHVRLQWRPTSELQLGAMEMSQTTIQFATFAVHLTVVDRSGNTLWSGIASGEAKRFGRSYKLENYYEVLCDAIVNTVSSMLQSAEFQKALSGR